MTNATFHNFTEEPFTGYWDGKPKTFKPGDRVYMPAYLAEHFAKHLANRELIKAGKEVYTSPKNPSQAPQFMEVFRKAFIADVEAKEKNTIDDEIAKAQVPSMDIRVEEPKRFDNGPAAAMAAEDAMVAGPGSEPQVISSPDGEADDESGFELGDK